MEHTEGRSQDGRSLRRSRNREAVLDAVVELFESGDVNPSIDDVAERACVSNRSVYRYFDHRDQLMRAAVTHAMRRVVPEIRLTDEGAGDFDLRVERFVDHRLSVYRRLAPITRAAKAAALNEPIIAEEFEAGRFMLRQQFLNHFAPELGPLRPAAQTRAVVAAELAFQFEAFEFLARAFEGDGPAMRELLVDQLHMTLGRLGSRADR